IRTASEAVATTSQRMGQAMYAAQGADAAAGAGPGSTDTAADDEGVVDAEIVDEPPAASAGGV
ncbi:MAG: hypothetical protein ABR520_10090, partial [Mycobacteriales bacterium]